MRLIECLEKNLWLRLAVVGGAISFAPAARAIEIEQDIAESVVPQTLAENSVLVATRKLDRPVEVSEEGGLQPIAINTEQEPVLADPEPPLAPEPETASVEEDRDVTQPLQVAVNPSAVTKTSAEDNTEDNSSVEIAPLESAGPQPAVFHGLQPGVSTKRDLLDAWGTPAEIAPTEAGQLLTYDLESFRGVEVQVENGVIELMKIKLLGPETAQALAGKVRAAADQAVEVIDPATQRLMAIAYPERGMVFVIDQPTEEDDQVAPEPPPTVSEMWLQPIDGDTFALRAENRPKQQYSARLADLERALELAPGAAHSHYLFAEVLLEVGRASEAEKAAKQAVDLEPENPDYQQRWGEALAAVGKYDEAVLATRQMLDDKTAPPLVRARALHQMGLLASRGDAEIANKSIHFHTLAIEEADKLATSDDALDRRAAKRLLIDAHLAIAEEISRRDYADKLENVAQWVTRASGYAEEMIANDEGSLDLRVRVAERSLAALANFKPANDPEPLIEEILDTIEKIKTESNDPVWIDQLKWSSGVAYLRAVQIEHHRRNADKALGYSEKATKLLREQAEARRDNPDTERLVGRLYFHIGALHAVHKKEHAEAVTWYDRAFPLLVTEAPASEFTVPRREGEALVSMAVSYWDQGDKQRALSLTEMGAELIEKAVEGGVVDAATLAVPYGNLAVMHEKLGNADESKRYNDLIDTLEQLSEVESPAQAEAKPIKPAPEKKEVAAKPLPKQTAQAAPSRTAPAAKPQATASRSNGVSGRGVRGTRWSR